MSLTTRYQGDLTLKTKGSKIISVDRRAESRIGPRTLGIVSIVMSTACLLSISFPYKTFAFVPPVLFPWHYSPIAFLLWIAACVTLSIIAGIWGSRLWLLGAAWAVFTLIFAMSAAV